MIAYLLLLVAVFTRVLPHAGWWNFTAVGGALLYFGARRPLREMVVPLAALMVTDYWLTVHAYHYAFAWAAYGITWAWYAGAMVLGRGLLHNRTTILRVGTGVIAAPTSFFLLSNFAVWPGSDMYPHTLGGLMACCAAGLPFYRNDLASTVVVCAAAFGLPVLLRRMHVLQEREALAGK
ncbi:MAG TPA: DUF6580 family putative transport protein [Terracidiphilus sp.]